MRIKLSVLVLLLLTAYACNDESGHTDDTDAVAPAETTVFEDASESVDVDDSEPEVVDELIDVDEPDPQDTTPAADVDEPDPQDTTPAVDVDEPDAQDTGGQLNTCESYGGSVQPIFDQHCTNCHNAPDADNLLNLTAGASYQSLMTTVSQADPSLLFMVPGDASASYLIEKLNPYPSYGHMMPITGPAGGTQLPGPQLQTLVDWIDAGATREPWGCR
jgi:hypothetical protein